MLNVINLIIQRSVLTILVAGVIGGLSQLLLPLSIVSSALIGLYLLRKGERAGLWVLLFASIIIYQMSFLIPSRPGLAFPVALIILVPVYVSSSVLRTTQSQGLAIVAVGICAALLAIGIQLYSGDAVAWWAEWLQSAVQGVKGATVEGVEENGTLQIMNGLIAMLLGIASILSLLLARWMQAALFNPGGFKKEFQLIVIPRKVLYLWIAFVALFAVMQSSLMYDLAIIGAMMYFFQGLSIFHYTTDKKGYSSAYLLPPYILLFFMPQFVVVGLACVGVTDAFINYRKLA